MRRFHWTTARLRLGLAAGLLLAACSPGDFGFGDRAAAKRGAGADTLTPEQRGYYEEWEVDKPAWPQSGNPTAAYPKELVAKQREGDVLLEFVVTPAGRVDMKTVKVLYSDDSLFTAAARRALARARYEPAEKGGRKVRQRARQPFSFRTES